jgi:hypothetical protein
VHAMTGSEDPQGWDNQLPDEPIINASYAYSRRVLAGNFCHPPVRPSLTHSLSVALRSLLVTMV